jgi:hypothetical protein
LSVKKLLGFQHPKSFCILAGPLNMSHRGIK